MTRVYCFAGYPGSGKSTACTLARDLGYPTVVMGDVVRSHARDNLGDEVGSEDIGGWASSHRDEHGNDVFAHYTADEVERLDDSPVIIDGLRTPTELDVFRKRFEDVTVVFVDASFETRLGRIQSRDRDGEGKFTEDDLRARDAREDKWGVGDLIHSDRTDVVLQNESSLSTFVNEVTKLIAQE